MASQRFHHHLDNCSNALTEVDAFQVTTHMDRCATAATHLDQNRLHKPLGGQILGRPPKLLPSDDILKRQLLLEAPLDGDAGLPALPLKQPLWAGGQPLCPDHRTALEQWRLKLDVPVCKAVVVRSSWL